MPPMAVGRDVARLDVAVSSNTTDKQVVVSAFQLASAHRKRRSLSAQKGGPLENFSVVAPFRQFVGRRQTRCSSADDAYSHHTSSID